MKLSQKAKLDVSREAQRALISGARDETPVQGLTHGFYKYPARFSPSFVRAAIEAFSSPGDVVLDNHAGGGTALVEAIALGRDAVGIDISSLAEFVTTVKTTIFTALELDELSAWAEALSKQINVRKTSLFFDDYEALGYYRHLNSSARWRVRKAIEQAIWSTMRLRSDRLESFGRCVILKTAQWALDGRKRFPSFVEFRERLTANAKEMIKGACELAVAISQSGRTPRVTMINRSAIGIELDERVLAFPTPKLIVTSPPYPGVHVLYHRWQVDGRKETPIPFLIANRLDGAGGSYYTMGDRKHAELSTYFDNIRASMASVAALAGDDTIIVQMVAFSDPAWQLERYLECIEEAGLIEVFLPNLNQDGDGRLWRRVPGRRWYSDQRGDTPASQEVVLIHRKSCFGERSASHLH